MLTNTERIVAVGLSLLASQGFAFVSGAMPYRLPQPTYQRLILSQRKRSNEKGLRRALPRRRSPSFAHAIDRESLRVDGCFFQYLILKFRVDAENKKPRLAALPEGRASIILKASRLDPFCSDIGTRSFDLDPLAPIVANGFPHCFGFLMNGNDVRYGPYVDSALVGLPGHLKILYDQ